MKELITFAAQSNPLEFLEQMLDLASSSPKMGEVMAGQPTIPVPYRQNFYRRFEELYAIRKGLALDEQVIYVRMVKERFGLDLLRFYDENTRLCDSTHLAVQDKEPYDRLILGKAVVLELEVQEALPAGSVLLIDEATDHVLGINAVGLHYWGIINPLLEKAYAIIEPTTLNAPFLTK